MAEKPQNQVFSQKRWQGIADYPKETANGQIQDAYYFGTAVNYRDDPQSITLLPQSVKKSGSVVTDLLKWGDRVPSTLTSFFYGNSGNLYQRTNAGTWSELHTAPGSHGNGLAYFIGDDYVYYATDTVLGRYGPTQSSPQFNDNFLGSFGGVPTNTESISLASASSMYVTAADSATLEITSDLSLGCWIKPTTLPTSGNLMTLLGKWDESGTTRGYRLSIATVSNYFGSGTDGSLTISSNTTEAPIDSTATGTAGTQTLTATNASFAAGQVIFIHQTQGTNAGQWERNTIQSYTAGTITTGTALLGTYTTGAQVRVLKQYTSVTINSGITYTAKAWNGTVGGILAFLANGTLTVTGNIVADSTGFRGGVGVNSGSGADFGNQGEGTAGTGTQINTANGNGGGGGYDFQEPGAGGGNGTAGGNGYNPVLIQNAFGGSVSGANDLTTMTFGGGGGGTKYAGGSPTASSGGNGGGILFLSAVTISVTGTITSNGGAGQVANQAGAGGGAGGSVLLKAQTATLGSSLITASGGTGGQGSFAGNGIGGNGGDGRIVLDYSSSYTGTTTPTLNAILDSSLGAGAGYQLNLYISANGTTFDTLSSGSINLQTGVWQQVAVSWKASTSTATFFLNAVAQTTAVGSRTAISSNSALLYIGADKGSSAVQNYYNGLMDEAMVISGTTTASFWMSNLSNSVSTATAGLEAYYEFEGGVTDSTANSNNGTAHNTPTYSTSVPFSGPTTRLDIDQKSTATGNTYTLPTSISETSTAKLSFTPALDPQASISFFVSTAGTGDWTVTIHDQQNNVIATKTITNANIPASGEINFAFSTPWRILLGKTYHAHLTVSTGSSAVVTGSSSDFSTAEFYTYYQFLVTDTAFHPIIQFQYQPLGGVLTGAMIIGNERYIAVWDGTTYTANYIVFPPAWHVRCFGFWREYLAIGMWRGSKITDYDQGRIYFWDGIAPTFNFFIDIPEGQINALFGADTDLYIIAGYRGYLLDYQGTWFQDTGNGQGIKLKRVPLIQPSDTIEVFPGAFTMWRSLLHIGFGANMSSSTIKQGVYAHGTYNKFYPDTMSYDYVISTGNQGSTVNIGLVYPIGQNLVVGWQDGISYGADEINFSNNPASSGELQCFIMDDNVIWKQKVNFSVRADFLPLKTGESIAPEISIDRKAFTVASPDSTVGDSVYHLPFAGGRGHEWQIGVKMYSTGTTSPTLRGLSLLKDKLGDEGQF